MHSKKGLQRTKQFYGQPAKLWHPIINRAPLDTISIGTNTLLSADRKLTFFDKGEAEHALSPLQQAQNYLLGIKRLLSGLERSDK